MVFRLHRDSLPCLSPDPERIPFHPVGLCIAVLILYLPLACHEWLPPFPSSKILFVRLPEFLFGMVFLDKIKRVKPWMLASAVIILILNTVLKPNLPESLQTTYVGISFFLVLAFVSKYLDRQPIRVICGSVSKYSYAVFLTHHFIIDQICSRFPMEKPDAVRQVYAVSSVPCCNLSCFLAAVSSSRQRYELFEAHVCKTDRIRTAKTYCSFLGGIDKPAAGFRIRCGRLSLLRYAFILLLLCSFLSIAYSNRSSE